MTEPIDVLVIGAGPAGLTAATELRRQGIERVRVVEREREAGGIPRHSDHLGYGTRDLRRMMTGPAYARELVERGLSAGVQISTSTMVTGWESPTSAWATSAAGRELIRARAVILATGARERPRSARLVPGDRPAGVLTTGQLQNLVHLHHQPVGTRAVVVGAELVSWSAVLTLREAGCRTVLMTTEHQKPESYAPLAMAGKAALGLPVARRAKVARIIGRQRVEAVELVHLDTGARATVECDTVVFTGDWIPDNELARAAGLTIDTGSRGPVVDTALRTSEPGVFAAGNLLHPVDTADVAALDGRHVATAVADYLARRVLPREGVRIEVEPPLRWIAPSIIRPGDPHPARGRYLLWCDEHIAFPRISVRQGGETIASRRLPWPASPGRVLRIPSGYLARIDPYAGDAIISID